MPESDWLTGLSSRAAFARLVNQADRDRDQFSIAILAVDDFAGINREMGYQAGDDLLRAIGRALAMQTSVATAAARLGGTQFGILGLQISDHDLQQWLRPVVSAAKSALETWVDNQHAFAGDCPVEPNLLVGAASGFSSAVWVNATVAIDVATSDPDGRQIVSFDTEDPRFVTIERQKRLNDRITAALADGKLALAADQVEVIRGGGGVAQWLRLAAFIASGPGDGSNQDTESTVIDSTALPNGLGRRVERWLIERAGGLIRNGTGQTRITVPTGSEAGGGRAFAERIFPLLEQLRIPPARLLFEVPEATLTEAGTRGWEFARAIDSIGAAVVLTDCEGGWATWRALEGLSIGYIRPHPDLVHQATNGNQPARRILSTVASNAEDGERELIAPGMGIANAILADLGFTYAERPYSPAGDTGTGR